jgi:hypothetical protein
MNVKIKETKAPRITFADIRLGSLFVYQGEAFLKIRATDENYNPVQLKNGDVTFMFGNYHEIRPVKLATLEVEV